jgi:hypothetical protein
MTDTTYSAEKIVSETFAELLASEFKPYLESAAKV